MNRTEKGRLETSFHFYFKRKSDLLESSVSFTKNSQDLRRRKKYRLDDDGLIGIVQGFESRRDELQSKCGDGITIKSLHVDQYSERTEVGRVPRSIKPPISSLSLYYRVF